MAVSPKKIEDLAERMRLWGVKAADLQESFVRGSGKGGQKVNKTNNCVCLIHVPSGMVVRCHRERVREINRYLARRALCDELEYRSTGIRVQRKSSTHRSPKRGITIIQRKTKQVEEVLAVPLPQSTKLVQELPTAPLPQNSD